MHQTWTDEHGLAHYVQHGRTFCGVRVSPTTAHAIDGCGGCVRASIEDYARRLAEREGLRQGAAARPTGHTSGVKKETHRKESAVTTALTPTVLPASPSHAESPEQAPQGRTRAFGLAYATTAPAGERNELTGLRYDPDRQITVTADGTPLADQPLTAASTSPTDTRYDNQWVTDHTPVD